MKELRLVKFHIDLTPRTSKLNKSKCVCVCVCVSQIAVNNQKSLSFVVIIETGFNFLEKREL